MADKSPASSCSKKLSTAKPKIEQSSKSQPRSIKTRKPDSDKVNLNDCSCVICEDLIDDATEDSVFCDGSCQNWIHRRCAGLSKTRFAKIHKSEDKFLCPHCQLESQYDSLCDIRSVVAKMAQEIQLLKAQVSSTITAPVTACSQPSVSPSTIGSYASVAAQNTHPNKTQAAYGSRNSERRFNMVVYGIPENPEGTLRTQRLENDLKECSNIIKTVCTATSADPIVDCQRLGKYSKSEERSRPILLHLARALDVTRIMSNRKNLVSMPGISIKPHMSSHERKVESVLLKERRLLINSGSSRSDIKITPSKGELHLSNKILGKVDFSSYDFVRTSVLSPQTPTLELTPNSSIHQIESVHSPTSVDGHQSHTLVVNRNPYSPSNPEHDDSSSS